MLFLQSCSQKLVMSKFAIKGLVVPSIFDLSLFSSPNFNFKFKILLTLNYAVFEQTAFLVLCTVAADTSRWTPKAQEGRIQITDTHTDTHDNYCNPLRACAPRVNKDLT